MISKFLNTFLVNLRNLKTLKNGDLQVGPVSVRAWTVAL